MRYIKGCFLKRMGNINKEDPDFKKGEKRWKF